MLVVVVPDGLWSWLFLKVLKVPKNLSDLLAFVKRRLSDTIIDRGECLRLLRKRAPTSGRKGEGVVARLKSRVFQNLSTRVTFRCKNGGIGKPSRASRTAPSTLPSLNSDTEFAEELDDAYFRPRKVVPQRDVETSERQSRQSDVTRVPPLLIPAARYPPNG
ncbi:hypothetical protein HN011_003868 [Eciton burchellii]|nr:hypothetical protein HN011_003868 [Eciton burchellii]